MLVVVKVYGVVDEIECLVDCYCSDVVKFNEVVGFIVVIQVDIVNVVQLWSCSGDGVIIVVVDCMGDLVCVGEMMSDVYV